MLHLGKRNAGFLAMTNCGVRSTLGVGRDGECELHQTARLFVQRSGLVAGLRKRRKVLLNFGMRLANPLRGTGRLGHRSLLQRWAVYTLPVGANFPSWENGILNF